ncbi:hypothetical protein IW492_11435 [Enterococcus sp. BWB1-3]|uniref:hypothetical protein n=1 Tax=Enterococcus sp. BWB1-3 TaxID=2787713 RepID=UPI00192383A1|nr:hypothetical protein [Enterococcus sp. BWB1-3]MBL1229844.1 hypothetical protein [Enterococcus sp. BWB1-3]
MSDEKENLKVWKTPSSLGSTLEELSKGSKINNELLSVEPLQVKGEALSRESENPAEKKIYQAFNPATKPSLTPSFSVPLVEEIQKIPASEKKANLQVKEEETYIPQMRQMIEKEMSYYRVTTEGEQIRSENIQISPFQFISILELTIIQSQGEHSQAEFKGIVSKEEADRILQLHDIKVPISISKRNESGKSFSFYEGLASSIEIVNEGNVYYIHGISFSYTYLMDIKKKSRSFQYKNQSYEQVVNQIVSQYENGAFLDTITNGQITGQFLIQFEETDWSFIKRLASHFNRQLITVDQYSNPRFYFGMPDTSVAGEIHTVEFQIEKDLAGFRQIQENQEVTASEQAFLRYQVQTNQLFILGDKVKFLDQEWYIADLERYLERGALKNKYLLTQVQGIMIEKAYNEQLTGSSINGTVASVDQDKVLLSLQIDNGEGKPAYWFPYSTNYTSDDNVGWYMMPEIGELVRLYYPTKDEKDAVAMSTVRTEDDSSSALDPNIKTLRNKFGKTITLEPDKITIVGNGVEIILNDSSGINITSKGSVSVTAEGALSLKGQNVVMDASDSVNISSHGNTISVSDKIALNGSEIKMN